MVSLRFAQRFCNLMKSSWLALIGMCNKKTVAQAAGEKLQTCQGLSGRGFDVPRDQGLHPLILQFSCNIWHDVVYFYGRSQWLFNHSLLTRLAGFGHTNEARNSHLRREAFDVAKHGQSNRIVQGVNQNKSETLRRPNRLGHVSTGASPCMINLTVQL